MALNLRLPPDLDLRLRKAAADHYMSLNTLIIQALNESRFLAGVKAPDVAREPGKLFSEAEAVAIAKQAPGPVLEPLQAPLPGASKAQRKAWTESQRLLKKQGRR